MEYLKIKNWDKWQTYRSDRGQPPWIKIHRCIMRNPEWVSLSDSERGQLVAIWLLAADHGGVIPASRELIAKLCFMSDEPNLNKFTELDFIEDGWRQDDVNVTAPGCRSDAPKAETEERREEQTEKKVSFLKDIFKEDGAKKILAYCKRILELPVSGTPFNPYLFVNFAVDRNSHPQAILDALMAIGKSWGSIKSPWSYGEKILTVQSPNYHERAHTTESEQFKKLWASDDITNIINNIGR